MIRINPAFRLILLLCAFASAAQAATTGALVDRQGRAVAGATIRALPFETEDALGARLASGAPAPEPLASATSDARGRFALEVDARYFRLTVDANGFVPLVERAERNEFVGAFLLSEADLVTIAIEGEGKPVAGAIVRASTQEVRTGEDGKAVLALPKGGGDALRIVHPEWAPLTRMFRRRTEIPKTIALSRGVAARGSVETAAGEPAAGATIELDEFPVATSGDDGTFVIPHAPTDWKQLTATRGDDIAVATRSAAAGYRLRLARGASISGTVVDGKTQMPIAGAPVSLTENRPGTFTVRDGISMPARSLTDAKGRFRIAPVLPGTYGISASRLGYEFASVTVDVKAGERADKMVSGQQLARASGMVLDEERKPVGAAAVGARADDPRRQVMFGGGGIAPPPPPPPMNFAMMRPSWSSADGEWVVREVPVNRETRLEASRAGFPRGQSDPMRLASGEKKEKVVLVIPRGITVEGRVVTRDGAPLANATVEARSREPGQQGTMTIVRRIGGPAEASEGVTTGADGSFTMQLARGTYDLVADADGYAPESARGIEVQGEVEPVTITLREAVAISGRVIRADGSGVPDVSINALSSGGSGAMTGADGSFTVDELAPGTVQLMALKTADFIREMRTVEAPSFNVEIKIPPGGTIRGRVLEKGTRKPITDFRAGPSGERRGTGMRMITPASLMPFRSEDGAFELTNVPVGPTEIVAEAAGYVTATANANVEEGKPADLTILLEAGTRVFGRVTSPEGTPLAGASVSLVANEDEIVPMVTRRSTTATTDGNGEYTIAGIGAGERSFRAAHESYPTLVKEANVSGRELRLDLQFPRGTDVTGVVVRDGGAPVAGAQVSASTALQGATSKGTTTDSNGNFRIEGLTPGRYNFFVRAEGASETMRDVDIATSGALRITLKAGGTVSGRVTGLQPSELSSANVNVSASNGYASAPVRSDGTFRVEGAPVGSVRVVASSGMGIGSRRQTAPKVVEVTAGGETYVDLDFASGNRVSGRVTRGGNPVGGASVIFQLKAGSSGAGGSTRTDAQGEYSIEGLEDGVYSVAVMDMQTMASHRTDYTVSGGGTFDIAMSSAALHGRVIDRETEEGISGVAVSLDSDQTSGMRFPPIQTDASGSFRLESVAPGNYRLRASRAGYGQEVLDVSVTGDAEQDLEVRMSKSAGVEIRVVDRRDGRALSAFISVADATGRLALEEYLSQTNERLSLAPGVYRAAISVSGYAPAVADVRSPGGPYTISLTPGGSLRIESSSAEKRRARIVDASGRPIVRGRINAPSEMTIDAAGATITGIEAGNYALEVLDQAGAVAARQTFAIVEGQTTTVRI